MKYKLLSIFTSLVLAASFPAWSLSDIPFFSDFGKETDVDGMSKDVIADQEPDDSEYSEGEQTMCEIATYKKYKGEHEDYFLNKGDKIAVISPCALPTREQTDVTIKGLREWGFEPVEGKYVCPKTRTLAELIIDLKWALNDPEIKGIYCVRGGYGASDVMDKVAIDLIKDANKPIIGYSDATIYHSAWTTAGLPSIHSCMCKTFMNLPEDCKEAEFEMMMGNLPVYRCKSEEKCVSGEATGVLVGGNLSTFTSVLNTAYDCTQTDEPYILFLEDVSENIQHIHRYLTILKHMGVLDKAQAIVFGQWTDLPMDDGDYAYTRGGAFMSVADMIQREFLDDLDVPVAFGFPAGHGQTNYPLLMGEQVHVTVYDYTYTIDWE